MTHKTHRTLRVHDRRTHELIFKTRENSWFGLYLNFFCDMSKCLTFLDFTISLSNMENVDKSWSTAELYYNDFFFENPTKHGLVESINYFILFHSLQFSFKT